MEDAEEEEDEEDIEEDENEKDTTDEGPKVTNSRLLILNLQQTAAFGCTQQVYLPGQALEEGEELVYDHTAYHMYHEVKAALRSSVLPFSFHHCAHAGTDWCAMFEL